MTSITNSWRNIRILHYGMLLSLATLVTIAPALAQDHPVHEDGGHDESEEIVVMSYSEITEFGIALDTAKAGTIHSQVTLPGEVSVNEDTYAHVSPRFSGIVKKVFKKVGDKVKRNDVLAIVESNESLTDFEVRSLIDGVIIDKHIVIGESASSEMQAFTVADLTTVWIKLSVFPMHLDEVRPGQRAIVTPNHGINETRGVISYLSPTVDEHSRTATARVVIENPDGIWRPGQFVEGVVEISSQESSLVIPRSALFTFEGAQVVFVYHEGVFEPRRVVVGVTDSQAAEILEGLSVGEVYAGAGGFTIKAELEKGSFGSGHSH